MLLAIILGIVALFVSGNLLVGMNVFLWSALVIALVLAFIAIRDLRRLLKPPPRERVFRWAPHQH